MCKSYPSALADGKITNLYPALFMKSFSSTTFLPFMATSQNSSKFAKFRFLTKLKIWKYKNYS